MKMEGMIHEALGDSINFKGQGRTDGGTGQQLCWCSERLSWKRPSKCDFAMKMHEQVMGRGEVLCTLCDYMLCSPALERDMKFLYQSQSHCFRSLPHNPRTVGMLERHANICVSESKVQQECISMSKLSVQRQVTKVFIVNFVCLFVFEKTQLSNK